MDKLTLKYSKRGVALVLVLAMLVLLSAIVLAFLASVTTDAQASKNYENQTSARMLADSAVNLVISQIREGSTASGVTWISQPGLIRTFNGLKTPVRAFKLYSSDELVVNGDFNPAAQNRDFPTTAEWNANKALWTDLNKPIYRNDYAAGATPEAIYPIFSADQADMGTDNTDPFYSKSGAAVLDVNGDHHADVEGFSIENYADRKAAMPVRWLYILKDGTLASADGVSKDKVTIVGPASATNPVVGRMAFWTDDESCKVNLNTASEGTFWDTPICTTLPSASPPFNTASVTNFDINKIFEWDLANQQPDRGEYQRYPGHPATTSLFPVFGRNIMDKFSINPDVTSPPMSVTDRQRYIAAIMKIAPRVNVYAKNSNTIDVSSKGGTAKAGGVTSSSDLYGKPIIPDTDRFFASIDEFVYTPKLNGLKREVQPDIVAGASEDEARKLLERTRFFITTTSKAPEQNLFNQPRISMWPITRGSISSKTDESKMTALDKLIAFCSTVQKNNQQFYFSREAITGPASPTVDFEGSERNKELYSYLQNLTNRPFPGFGEGSFVDKYTTPERDQILMEIFDYIRCTNLMDTTEGNVTKSYTQVSLSEATSPKGTLVSKRGQVVPIAPTSINSNPRGFGRIATICEMTILVSNWRDPSDPGTKNGITGATKTKLQVALIPSIYSPMAGFGALANDIRMKFRNVNTVKVDGQTAITNNTDVFANGLFATFDLFESKIGGYIGPKTLVEVNPDSGFINKDSQFPWGTITSSKTYNDPSKPVPTVTLEGDFYVDVYAPATNGKLIQTFHFVFPQTNIPTPKQPSGQFEGIEKAEFSWDKTLWKPPGQFGRSRYGVGGYNWGAFSYNEDVTRSVQPLGLNGDIRSIACLADVDAIPDGKKVNQSTAIFQPLYSDPSGLKTGPYYNNLQIVGWGIHSARMDGPYYQVLMGSLLAGPPKSASLTNQNLLLSDTTGPVMEYDTNNPPEIKMRPWVPAGINGVAQLDSDQKIQVGDWDNGYGYLKDGSYLNKPDEGSNSHPDSVSSERPPYIGHWWSFQDAMVGQSAYFSPNRLIPSPVMFGSLPTGVKRGLAWQTLLFRPATSYFPGGENHSGATRNGAVPPDHLLLDLFWMPVVEPYPISEPFATSGKVNMNYQIVPFSNIKRSTAMRAVLESVKLTAMNPNQVDQHGKKFSQLYKLTGLDNDPQAKAPTGGVIGVSVRRSIDITNTLRQFDEDRFANNNPFLSASEICDVPLIPAKMAAGISGNSLINTTITPSTDITAFKTQLEKFWNGNYLQSGKLGNYRTQAGHFLTGDNSLERPYALLYSRLTTKSNTYTVHVCVQTLKKALTSVEAPTDFEEAKNRVTSEFRGSFIIERYLDPNTAEFNSNAANTEQALGPYKFRVISSKQFLQ